MRKLVIGTLVLAATLPPVAALAMEAVTVIQRGRAFSVQKVTVPRGGTINFTNQDDFPHQLNVSGPDMDVDAGMQEQGETISVPFSKAGQFEVRCGIHPRMRLTVRVE